MICLLLALCLCLGLAACGGTPAQDNSNNGGTTESDGQNTADNSTEPQLSGKVTVYMPSPAGLADDLAAAFTEKTGVEVEQFQGTTGEILARLEAEQANPVADAYLLPGRSDIQCENRTNLSDITLIPTDWDKMMEVASDTAAKLNSLCQ